MNTLNERATLKALNKKFPELTLDQLFSILDSLVFNYEYTINWDKSNIWCGNDSNINCIKASYADNKLNEKTV